MLPCQTKGVLCWCNWCSALPSSHLHLHCLHIWYTKLLRTGRTEDRPEANIIKPVVKSISPRAPELSTGNFPIAVSRYWDMKNHSVFYYLIVVRTELHIRVVQTSNIRGIYNHTSRRNFSKTKYVSVTNTTRKEFIYLVLNLGGTCPLRPLSPQYCPPKLLKMLKISFFSLFLA